MSVIEEEALMKQMNIACYCVNFDNYDFLYDIVDNLQFAGVGVELSMFSDRADFMKELLEQKDRFSKFPVTFHGPYMEVEATSELESEEHKMMIKAYEESFRIYHEFHAGSIVMHTNQRGFTEEERPVFRKNAIETIKEIALMAEKEKVNLLVENVGETVCGNMLFGEEEFIELFEQLPDSTGCLIDIGHAIINQWDLEHVISSLKHKIRSYHLHSNDGKADIHRPLFEKGRQLPPDKLKALIDCIERNTPDADWILEYAPGEHITTGLIIDEVKRLRSMMP